MIKALLVILLGSALHPHHFSICEMTYREESGTIELVQQVFADDLESWIKLSGGETGFDIRAGNEEVQSRIRQFAKSHIELRLDGRLLEQNWIGYKIEGNQLKFFIEFEKVAAGTLAVTNRIFLDMLAGQENVIRLKLKGEYETRECNGEKRTVEFRL